MFEVGCMIELCNLKFSSTRRSSEARTDTFADTHHVVYLGHPSPSEATLCSLDMRSHIFRISWIALRCSGSLQSASMTSGACIP